MQATLSKFKKMEVDGSRSESMGVNGSWRKWMKVINGSA